MNNEEPSMSFTTPVAFAKWLHAQVERILSMVGVEKRQAATCVRHPCKKLSA